MRYLFLSLVISLLSECALCQDQNNACESIYKSAAELVNSSDPDYQLAIKKLSAYKLCCNSKDNKKADDLLLKIYMTVNQQKKNAENATKIAIEQRNIAQANYLISEARSALVHDPTLALRLTEQALKTHFDPINQKAAAKIYKENSFYRIIEKRDSIRLEEQRSKGYQDVMPYYQVSFSPDGKNILTLFDSMIVIRDLNGKWIKDFILPPYDDYIILPDLTKIIYRNSVLLSVLTGDTIAKFKKHDSEFTCFDISNSGDTIITGNSTNKVELWKLSGKTYELIRNFIVKVDATDSRSVSIFLVALSHDCHWALAIPIDLNELNTDSDAPGIAMETQDVFPKVHLYDLRNSVNKSVELGTHKCPLAKFSPGGDRIILLEYDKEKRFGDPSSAYLSIKSFDLKGNLIDSLFNEGNKVRTFAFSSDGTKFLTGDIFGIVRLFEKDGKKLFEFKGHSDRVGSVAISPDGTKVLSGSADFTARLWELKGTCRQKIEGHKPSFSSDGKMILTANDDSIFVWNLQGGLLTKFETQTFCGSEDLSLSSTGKTIIYACAYDSVVNFYDMETKKITKSYSPFKFSSLAISPDGQTILLYSEDEEKGILTDLNLNVTKKFEIRDVRHVAFSPAGKPIFAISSEECCSARLLDEQGKILNECKSFSDDFDDDWTFSTGGKFILVSRSTEIRFGRDSYHRGVLMDIKGNNIFDIPPYIVTYLREDSTEVENEYEVTSISISPDGKIIATGYDMLEVFDPEACIWIAPLALDDFLKSDQIEPLSVDQKKKYGIKKF